MADEINGFATQISRELGNVDARLSHIEEMQKNFDIKLDALKSSVDKRIGGLSAKIYMISGGIAVCGIVAGVFFKKLFGV